MSEIPNANRLQSRSYAGIGWLVDHFPVEPVRIHYRLYSVRVFQPNNPGLPSTYNHGSSDANEFLAVYELDKTSLQRIVEDIYQVHCQLIDHIDIPLPLSLQNPLTKHALRNTFVRVYGLREGLPCASIQFRGEMLTHEQHSEHFQSMHFTLYDILNDARGCQESQAFDLHPKPATSGICGLMNRAIRFERRMSQDYNFLVEDLTRYATI